MQEILSDYADDEDLPAILEDTVFVGVKGSVYPTVEGYTPSSYAAEWEIEEKARDNRFWTRSDESAWRDEEDKYLRAWFSDFPIWLKQFAK